MTDLRTVFEAVCPGPSPSCATPADFADAIDLMVKAFVMAPSFLYRTELGPRNLTANTAGDYPDTVLTGDEVATQLGFLLLGSTPDAGLLAAADSGALDTPAGILAEIDRLLALPPTKARATGMVTRWLGVDQVADKAKAPALLSPLAAADQDQAAITAALRTSWDDAVTATLWSSPPGKVTDLLTAQTFYADWRLATLYGFPHDAAVDPAFHPLTWPAVQPRAGVLTHPAFLWAISAQAQVDPVMRGQAVHRDFLCADPVPFEPPGASMAEVAVIQMGDSEATHSDARLASGKLCAEGCHTELDPYGRLLHAFDAAGNFRTVDEVGRPIDTSAKLTDTSPLGAMTFSGPVDFAAALVSSKVFAGCAVQRLFEAALAVTVPARNAARSTSCRRPSTSRTERWRRCSGRSPGRHSRAPAQEEPSDVVQDGPPIVPARVRWVGGAAAAVAAIDGGPRRGRRRTQAAADPAPRSGIAAGPVAPGGQRHDAQRSPCRPTARRSRRCSRRWC